MAAFQDGGWIPDWGYSYRIVIEQSNKDWGNISQQFGGITLCMEWLESTVP